MPLRLDYQASDFDAQFKALLSQKRETESDVVDTVKAILNDVKGHWRDALEESIITYSISNM